MPSVVKIREIKCVPAEIPGKKGDRFDLIVVCEYHDTEPAYVAIRPTLNGLDLGIVETDGKVNPGTAVKFAVTVVLDADFDVGLHRVGCQAGYRFDKKSRIVWTDIASTTIRFTGKPVPKRGIEIPDYVKYGAPIVAAGTIIPFASTRKPIAAVAGLAASTAVYHFIIWPRIKRELEAGK